MHTRILHVLIKIKPDHAQAVCASEEPTSFLSAVFSSSSILMYSAAVISRVPSSS